MIDDDVKTTANQKRPRIRKGTYSSKQGFGADTDMKEHLRACIHVDYTLLGSQSVWKRVGFAEHFMIKEASLVLHLEDLSNTNPTTTSTIHKIKPPSLPVLELPLYFSHVFYHLLRLLLFSCLRESRFIKRIVVKVL